jgi:hypothetical protein
MEYCLHKNNGSGKLKVRKYLPPKIRTAYYISILSQIFNLIFRYCEENRKKNQAAITVASILPLGNEFEHYFLQKFPAKVFCVKLKQIYLPITNSFIIPV